MRPLYSVLLTGGQSDVTKNGNGLMTEGTMMNHPYNIKYVMTSCCTQGFILGIKKFFFENWLKYFCRSSFFFFTKWLLIMMLYSNFDFTGLIGRSPAVLVQAALDLREACTRMAGLLAILNHYTWNQNLSKVSLSIIILYKNNECHYFICFACHKTFSEMGHLKVRIKQIHGWQPL